MKPTGIRGICHAAGVDTVYHADYNVDDITHSIGDSYEDNPNDY